MTDRWHEPVKAIGIAMPATLDLTGRVSRWPTRPHWAGLDLGSFLAGLITGATVRWADDGDLAAIAEARAAGCDDLVYLGIGTGIGGGIVSGGIQYPRSGRGSCEIGHVVIDRFGPECDCGRHGCLQAVASGPATLRRAAVLRGSAVSFDELKQAFSAAQGWATAAVAETCAALAVAVVSLDELIHPDRFVLGGGFATELADLAPLVSAHAAELVRTGQPVPLVTESILGSLASLHGAELLARGIG